MLSTPANRGPIGFARGPMIGLSGGIQGYPGSGCVSWAVNSTLVLLILSEAGFRPRSIHDDLRSQYSHWTRCISMCPRTGLRPGEKIRPPGQQTRPVIRRSIVLHDEMATHDATLAIVPPLHTTSSAVVSPLGGQKGRKHFSRLVTCQVSLSTNLLIWFSRPRE